MQDSAEKTHTQLRDFFDYSLEIFRFSSKYKTQRTDDWVVCSRLTNSIVCIFWFRMDHIKMHLMVLSRKVEVLRVAN